MEGKDDLEAALLASEDVLNQRPDFYPGPVFQAALQQDLGRLELAREAAARVRQIDPQFSVEVFIKSLALKNAEFRARLSAALLAAGLSK